MESQNFPKLILYEGFGERDDWEIAQKGWFCAHVELEDGSRYEINFYDPVRLIQEYNDIVIRDNEPCYLEFNIIIIPKVTIDAVRKCIHYLWTKKYFDYIKGFPKDVYSSY